MNRHSKCSRRNLTATPPIFRPVDEPAVDNVRPDPSTTRVEIYEKFGIPDPTVGGSSIYVALMSSPLTLSSSNFTFIRYINHTLFQSLRLQSLSISNHHYALYQLSPLLFPTTTTNLHRLQHTHNAFPTLRSASPGSHRRRCSHLQQTQQQQHLHHMPRHHPKHRCSHLIHPLPNVCSKP